MSVRAYPIIEIKHGGEVFNLWHDEYFLSLLERQGLTEQLNMDGCGIMGICEVMLKGFEKAIKEDKKNKETKTRTKEIIKDIRAEMKKQKTDCIDFYCF